MKLTRLISSFLNKETTKVYYGGKYLTSHEKKIMGHNDKFNSDITSIHYRAQDVKPGGMFVAVSGFSSDGHDYIDEAVNRGALAILSQRPLKKDIPAIVVNNTRKALAEVSAKFYGNPSEKLIVVGITGTNGKTTITYLIESILTEAGYQTGVIGTINYRYGGKTFKNSRTTPESLDLQSILSNMRKSGITHVVLEVASHGIDLFRVAYCWLDIAVFTNLSQDHLDYHNTMDAYWACKKKLFTKQLVSGPKKYQSFAVINTNDEKGKELTEYLSRNHPEISLISAGFSMDNTIKGSQIDCDLNGTSGKLTTAESTKQFHSHLIGKHNAENILCAAGVGDALEVPLSEILKGIESVESIPGRLERVPNKKGRYVYIDYAHTPDALEKVLSSLRILTTGRVICIFGCGGDRDKEKRAQMGKIAGEKSDVAILTSDNPRSEAPMAIISQIESGIKKTSFKGFTPLDLTNGFPDQGYLVEPDRKRAIKLGIQYSRIDDVVLVAGKGHETDQIMSDRILPFSDRKEAILSINEIT